MAQPENISIAVGIALLARLEAEIYTFLGCRLPSWIFSFFRVESYGIDTCPIGMADPENIEIAL